MLVVLSERFATVGGMTTAWWYLHPVLASIKVSSGKRKNYRVESLPSSTAVRDIPEGTICRVVWRAADSGGCGGDSEPDATPCDQDNPDSGPFALPWPKAIFSEPEELSNLYRV